MREAAPPNMHYGRSPEGLWVRASLTPTGIALDVQERVVWAGARWIRLGPDGVEVARGGPHDLRATDPWEPLGTIPLPLGEVPALVPLVQFDRLAYGVMRHAVGLIVGGWGDHAADIAGWFCPLAEGYWVVREATYLLRGPFLDPIAADFAGAVLREVRVVDAGVEADLVLPGVAQAVRWEGLTAIGAFAVGAVLDPTL